MRAFLEFVDSPVGDPADPRRGGGYAKDGWIAIDRVLFSDHAAPPPEAPSAALVRARDARRAGIDELYGIATRRAAQAARAGAASRAQLRWLDWLGRHGLLLEGSAYRRDVRNAALVAREENRALAQRGYAPVLRDASPVAHAVHIRGSHKALGDVVPPRILSALEACCDTRALARERENGSGRLALARAITNPDNPLTARVIVNRVWHHMFGRGLVATTDNFGVLGAKPTHPKLLDYLATSFVSEDAWSLKTLLRRIALSASYRMSSAPSPAIAARARDVDADNQLLHKARIRRLSGEALRDAMLAVSWTPSALALASTRT